MGTRATIRDHPAAVTNDAILGVSVSPQSIRRHLHYRPDIDGLRALAIIPVVTYHAFPDLIPGGFVGVDVFFVISGFLISGILLKSLAAGTFSFPAFYANRVRRLFPALLLVLTVCLVCGWFFLLPDEYANLGKHTIGALSYIENFILRRETGYFDTRASLKPLMHLWSLGIEEQFYLTYPLFLWMMWRLRRYLFAVVVFVAALSFSLNLMRLRHDPSGAFFLPQTRCWELAVGCAIACWQLLPEGRSSSPAGQRFSKFVASKARPRTESLVTNLSSVLGAFFIVTAVLAIHENNSFPGWWALLPVCGAALLIVGGPDAWINRRILAARFAVFVGLISYPVYLWHWPILAFARIVHGSEVSAGVRIAGVLLSFALAWVTFRFVESPIRFGPKTWIKPAALVAASLGIAALGYAARRGGFSERFPSYVADVGRLQDVVWSTPECRAIAGIGDINYCRTTSNRPPDVLLIGDSHATVLYDGLAPAYERRSLTLMNLGQSGCAPFYDTRTFSPDRRELDCIGPVNRMIEYASHAPSVRTIIFSSRGPKYISGADIGATETGAEPKKIVYLGAAPGTPQAEVYAQALQHTMALLTSSGKQVVVFLDWPELGFDPRSCLQRPVMLFSQPRPVCAVPRTQVDARNRDYRELIFGLQKQFAGLKIFDPLPFLCDSSRCYAMKDNHLLYSDDNHVSKFGAGYLSGKYFENLQPE